MPFLPYIDFILKLRKEKYSTFSEILLNLEKLTEMLVQYKMENGISGQDTIYCTLAVDALYFRPDIKISPKGVEGFSKDIEISKKDFNKFANDIEYFMSFLKANWKDIIRSGFVFQMNPLDVSYKPIVVFIYPSKNDKANNSIIQKLYEIKSILHNHRIETVSFSFDGDNAYKNLNLSFFESLINRMIKQNTIPLGRMISIRISPDYSHIVKRLRYRILSHRIHMGFTMDSPVIDMNEVQRVLKNIPPIVFSDVPLTKMHDVLPLTLFFYQILFNFLKRKCFLLLHLVSDFDCNHSKECKKHWISQ